MRNIIGTGGTYCCKNLYFVMVLATILFVFSSCEKVDAEADDAVNVVGDGGVKVDFHISNLIIEQYAGEMPTSLAPQSCSRLNFAIFDDVKRLKVINQTAEMSSFGNISLEISPGTYSIVVLAHNGLGNASISSPEQIKFKDNKVTDTFYYCGTVNISGEASYDITLKRAVAKCHITIKDRFPSAVALMRFKYTGGSSTFNAVTGYGCVNSRQTEERSILAPDENGATSFDLFTFPHNNDDLLNITVMALNANGDILYSKVIDDVMVNINRQTTCDGNLFESDDTSEDGDFIVTTHDELLE